MKSKVLKEKIENTRVSIDDYDRFDFNRQGIKDRETVKAKKDKKMGEIAAGIGFGIFLSPVIVPYAAAISTVIIPHELFVAGPKRREVRKRRRELNSVVGKNSLYLLLLLNKDNKKCIDHIFKHMVLLNKHLYKGVFDHIVEGKNVGNYEEMKASILSKDLPSGIKGAFEELWRRLPKKEVDKFNTERGKLNDLGLNMDFNTTRYRPGYKVELPPIPGSSLDKVLDPLLTTMTYDEIYEQVNRLKENNKGITDKEAFVVLQDMYHETVNEGDSKAQEQEVTKTKQTGIGSSNIVATVEATAPTEVTAPIEAVAVPRYQMPSLSDDEYIPMVSARPVPTSTDGQSTTDAPDATGTYELSQFTMPIAPSGGLPDLSISRPSTTAERRNKKDRKKSPVLS